MWEEPALLEAAQGPLAPAPEMDLQPCLVSVLQAPPPGRKVPVCSLWGCLVEAEESILAAEAIALGLLGAYLAQRERFCVRQSRQHAEGPCEGRQWLPTPARAPAFPTRTLPRPGCAHQPCTRPTSTSSPNLGTVFHLEKQIPQGSGPHENKVTLVMGTLLSWCSLS